jgi:hypothetical protein
VFRALIEENYTDLIDKVEFPLKRKS